ncbi:MAG: ATP synthase F1 subunit delta [Mangrovibacterium sp.]
MDYSAIAVRYAKAFFNLASEKNLLEEVKADMDLLSSLFKGKELKLILENRIIKAQQKNTLLQAGFQGKISSLSLNFIKLVVDNGRSAHFEGMCRYFISLYRKKQNLKSVLLTTAVDIDKETSLKLTAKLEYELHTKVELQTRVDPALIGGFVLRIDDQQYDASVQHKLQQIRTSMLNANV